MECPAPSARPPPTFSLQEFNELLCSAFNLPCDSLPPRDALAQSRSCDNLFSPLPSTSSCFDSDTEDDEPSPAPSRAPSVLSRTRTLKSRASSFGPLNVFRHVRERASALVLRANLSSAASTYSKSSGGTHTARQSLSSQRTLTPRLRSAASSFALVSRPSTPAPRPSSPFPFASELPSRRRDPPSPISFLRLPRRTQSRPATPVPSQLSGPTFAPAPSFNDSAYDVCSQAPWPPYARPGTPVPPPSPPRVHARLPPLRTSKSYSIFGRSRSRRRTRSGLSLNARYSVTDDLDNAQGDAPRHWPSAFTCPRDAPPVPPLPSGVRAGTPVPRDEIEVPDYVYARRGSATSTGTSGSGSSLSSRISSLLPLRSRLRGRTRSKLSLRVVPAPGSTYSSPGGSGSSTSTHETRSPTTPTFGDAFGAGYTFGTATVSVEGHEELRAEALGMGRVLTPVEDPFAKGDVCVEKSAEDVCDRGKTPTPGVVTALAAGWQDANRDGSLYEESTYESALDGESSFGDDEYYSAESGSGCGAGARASASGFTPTKRASGLRPSLKARSRSLANLRAGLGRFPLPPPLPASVSESYPYAVAAPREVPVGVPVDIAPESPGEASVGLWDGSMMAPVKEKEARPASLPVRASPVRDARGEEGRRWLRASAPSPLPERPGEMKAEMSTSAGSASTLKAAMASGQASIPRIGSADTIVGRAHGAF
ncbi:hypothetical protein CERSUDRAFT_110180 [Gelatoporia subvermispora B]|uniref:Uncharacterized protein n=1 Tax=Ceriporiopsis subvermispora (strain B) TaxID=914234 RepID=M2PXJ6_CERS8|nr:hypothetical protein CERSUDRAFT_110180 [Gelatoporia subvermispora B]